MTDIQFLSVPEVTLEDSMGDDLAVVNAARVSFANRSQLEEWCELGCGRIYNDQGRWVASCTHSHHPYSHRMSERDCGLISYLMRERHGTPFEMVQFKFRISAPIRVMREWQRHRIGSFNETSTRYVEMEPKFFVPDAGAVRTQTGKPGHYQMEPMGLAVGAHVGSQMREAYDAAWTAYENMINIGVAKELAAYVLPLGLYSEQIWSVNMRALFNFVSLRNAPNALQEIREAAVIVEQLASAVAPFSFGAFETHGRKQP